MNNVIEEYLQDVRDRHAAFEDQVLQEGTLSLKEKRLCAVVAANLGRDKQNLQKHMQKAEELGADEDEIAGAMSAAWMTAGSTQIYWAQDLFEEEIEHAWYKRRLKEASKAFGKFHEAVMEKGPLPEVLMEILCAIVGCMERCEHCTRAHIKQALDKGASKDQIAEALAVAWLVGGDVQAGWLDERIDDLL